MHIGVLREHSRDGQIAGLCGAGIAFTDTADHYAVARENRYDLKVSTRVVQVSERTVTRDPSSETGSDRLQP